MADTGSVSRVLVVAVALMGCRQVFGLDDLPSDATATAIADALNPDAVAVTIDAPADAARDCEPDWLAHTIRFDAPVLITELDSPEDDRDPSISADEHTIYFSSERPGGLGLTDIYTATRTSLASPFTTPVAVAALNTPSNETKLTITDDELELVIASDRPGGQGLYDLWHAKRASTQVPWNPLNEAQLGSEDDANSQFDPQLSIDGLHLYYAPLVGTIQVIMFATRATRTVAFGTPTVLGITSFKGDADPAPSADELVIVYSSMRAGGTGHLYYATRTDATKTFDAAVVVPDVGSTMADGDPQLSRDGCRLYFASQRSGNWAIYVATAM